MGVFNWQNIATFIYSYRFIRLLEKRDLFVTYTSYIMLPTRDTLGAKRRQRKNFVFHIDSEYAYFFVF